MAICMASVASSASPSDRTLGMNWSPGGAARVSWLGRWAARRRCYASAALFRRAFLASLRKLMGSLESTQAHFIRCIKPNKELASFKFTPSLVLTQLRCSGTIDAVQLMAGGTPPHRASPLRRLG
mgnify:CR=1 FL=1